LGCLVQLFFFFLLILDKYLITELIVLFFLGAMACFRAVQSARFSGASIVSLLPVLALVVDYVVWRDLGNLID